MVGPVAKRRAAGFLAEQEDCSERRACRLVGFSRGTYRREPIKPTQDKVLRTRLRRLARLYPRYGYRRMHAQLLGEGFIVNQKKVQRLWREEGLKVPQRAKRQRRRGQSSGVPTRATKGNHVWTWDFIQDRSEDGRALRILTILDEFSRFNVCLHVARSITAEQVIDQLDQAIAAYGKPSFIRSDNGPEFIAKAIEAYLQKCQINTIYIAPGSPWENPFVESFHGRLRNECLDRETFGHLLEARAVLAEFREHYNYKRPHSALKYQAPAVIFFRRGAPDASAELFTAANSTPTSMVAHSRRVGSHNNSPLIPT